MFNHGLVICLKESAQVGAGALSEAAVDKLSFTWRLIFKRGAHFAISF